MSINKQPTALLDLKGLVEHSYHALMTPEPLQGVKEVNTVTFGFASFLSLYYDLIVDTVGSPLNIIAVIDSGNTYRKAMFPSYKSHRATVVKCEVEEGQKGALHKAVKAFLMSQGCTLVRLEGEEADDVIAHLALNLQGKKLIYTVDRDLIALSNKNVCVLFRAQQVEDLRGIPPACISVYKSLVGDTSDGYPGVKGFGEAAWKSIVDQFGYDGIEEIDTLLRTGDKVKLKAVAHVANNKAFTKAVDNLDDWQLMFRLACLSPHICEGSNRILDWVKRVPTRERLVNVMEEMGCPDLVSKYQGDCYESVLVSMANFSECMEEILGYISESPYVAWDYETVDIEKNPNYVKASGGKGFVDVLGSDITGCSFAVGRNVNKVYYLSINHRNTANLGGLGKDAIKTILMECERTKTPLVAQNINFEFTITSNVLGLRLDSKNSMYDTKLFAHHIDEDSEHGLKYLSQRYLNYPQVSYSDTLIAAGANDMSEISGEDVLNYGCDDSVVTAHLMKLFSFITQVEGSYNFVVDYECPAVRPISEAFIGGIKVDTDKMQVLTAKDIDTVNNKFTAIRSALLEHCKKPSTEAINTLYEDQKSYIALKAKLDISKSNPLADPLSVQAAIDRALADYLMKLKVNSYYEEPYEVSVVKEFIPTITQISEVTTGMNLPAFTGMSKDKISDWVDDINPIYEHHKKFLKLLGPAVEDFAPKRRSSPAYLKFKEFCESRLTLTATKVWKGTELNMNSPVQNIYLFYLLLGLPIRTRTTPQKGSVRDEAGLEGSPSTDENAIEVALANDCTGHDWKRQLLEDLLEYKEASTRIGNYWTSYPYWLDHNNIMHPGFNSCGTVTRRPTGSKPNILQVSKGSTRDIFVPRSADNVIISVDFSSEELRILADACKDANFLSAYSGEKAKDLHALTACGLVPNKLKKYPNIEVIFDSPLRVNYDWFKEHQEDEGILGEILRTGRKYAKVANFGVAYGAGPPTLSRQLRLPINEAEEIFEGLDAAYPGIQRWKDRILMEAKVRGYVVTPYGSRRHCGNKLTKGDNKSISRMGRQLCNFLIQGVCADLLKVALVSMDDNDTLAKHDAILLAMIYDELLFEIPKANVYNFLQDISDDMEQNIPGSTIPMVADCSIGITWGTQIELGQRPTQEKVDESLKKL